MFYHLHHRLVNELILCLQKTSKHLLQNLNCAHDEHVTPRFSTAQTLSHEEKGLMATECFLNCIESAN